MMTPARGNLLQLIETWERTEGVQAARATENVANEMWHVTLKKICCDLGFFRLLFQGSWPVLCDKKDTDCGSRILLGGFLADSVQKCVLRF